MRINNACLTVSVVLVVAGCGSGLYESGADLEDTDEKVTSGSTYNFKLPLLTNSCMDVNGAGTADGTNIQEWQCNGGGAQKFTAVSLGNGFFKLVNPNSGKCVDVSANGTADGTNIQLWTCNGTSAQAWAFQSSNGFNRIVGQNSGKCIDVSAAGTANGTNVQLWTCNGTAAQTWNSVLVGSSTTTTTTTTGGGTTVGNFPSRFSAPYVPVWNNTNLANLASSTGNKFWTVAFMLSNGSCAPAWNGDTCLTCNSYGSYITSLRNNGGDAIISFGGAGGRELGLACGSVSSLQSAYQQVINQFQLKWMDLDIESGTEGDFASVDRRNKALHNLQGANPGLHVTYTLAVSRGGLGSAQINLLNNAKANGVTVHVVNIMAMDYGPCYSDMGQAAIDAASATRNQLANNGISARVGVTPMIGVNDVTCEVFSASNAQQLVNYAQANSYISLLAYWSQDADPNHTYINIFKTFH